MTKKTAKRPTCIPLKKTFEFWVTNYLKPTLSFYHDYRNLPAALDEFDPDVVVYNAGTDILEGDQLGNLDITPEVAKLSSPPPLPFLSHTLYIANLTVLVYCYLSLGGI